jgi:hypothetical protein
MLLPYELLGQGGIAMQDEQETTAVRVNPLMFMSLDPVMQRAQGLPGPPEPAALLSDILTTGKTTQSIKDVISRYERLSPLDPKLQITIHDDWVLTEIVELARSAKTLYLIAQYRACIALCGYVGETIATFVFEQTKLRVGGRELTPSQTRALLGKPFEELEQGRRIDIIKVLLGWDQSQVSKAHELRTIRNRYLHRKVPPATALEEKDAITAYRLAVELAEPFANLKLGSAGSVAPTPGQLQYLREGKGDQKSESGD